MTAKKTLLFACLVAGAAVRLGSAQAPSSPLGIGRTATADEVRALDIDVMPDGRGLPAGRGTAAEGAVVYAAKCATCHGASGEGGSAERLVGRNDGDSFAFATNPRLVRTIGSYWPYATTLYDYTSRSMPFGQPGTLAPDETYSLVAFLLFRNGVIPETAVMDQASLPKVAMPARDRFVPDNRNGGPVVK
jgi:cytochrome c